MSTWDAIYESESRRKKTGKRKKFDMNSHLLKEIRWQPKKTGKRTNVRLEMSLRKEIPLTTIFPGKMKVSISR